MDVTPESDSDEGQAELLRGLTDPRAFPHPADDLQQLETHISRIVLAGPFAYKIKKPVQTGFLDYRSLDDRRRMCLREVEWNRRFAPQLYLDVVPIARAKGGFRVGGSGPVLEYAVRMRRFPPQALLSVRLKDQTLSEREVDALADSVASFHLAAERAPRSAAWGNPESIGKAAQANLAFFETLPTLPQPALRPQLDAVRFWTEKELTKIRDRFVRRRNDGWVRACHGDLHLANVIAWENDVTPFDGIEFNDELRWIDVLSDTAFAFMDFCAHRRPDFAFRFLNRYLEQTGDYADLQVLRWYAVYRAMVRAMVAALRSAQADCPGDERQRQETTASGQIELALALTRPAYPPTLVITHGVSGSGKSYQSQNLMQRLPAIRIRSDRERQRMPASDEHTPPHTANAPTSPTEPPASATAPAANPTDPAATATEPTAHTNGRGAPPVDPAERYSAQARSRVYTRLEGLAQAILAAGYSVIVDATFLHQADRARFAACAAACGAEFRILACAADRQTLEQRIGRRAASGGDPSEAGLDVLAQQLRDLEALTPVERSSLLP